MSGEIDHFGEGTSQYCRNSSSSQMSLNIKRNSNQNPNTFFMGIDKVLLKLIWKSKV